MKDVDAYAHTINSIECGTRVSKIVRTCENCDALLYENTSCSTGDGTRCISIEIIKYTPSETYHGSVCKECGSKVGILKTVRSQTFFGDSGKWRTRSESHECPVCGFTMSYKTRTGYPHTRLCVGDGGSYKDFKMPLSNDDALRIKITRETLGDIFVISTDEVYIDPQGDEVK